MARINEWYDWDDKGNEDWRMYVCLGFNADPDSKWYRILPSKELSAALCLLEPTHGSYSGKTWELEDDIVRSLGYEVHKDYKP